MNIIIVNATGSQKVRGHLHGSGMIELEDGEITHVLHEKQFGKSISKEVVVKLAPKEEVKEIAPEVKPETNFGKAKKPTTAKKV